MIYKKIEDVPVWIKAQELAVEVYKIARKFPKSEEFGLMSQVKRSSSSVPANISEGFYRNTNKELIQYLYTARGSLGETISHMNLAMRLEYISNKDYEILKSRGDEIGKQLNGWIKSLKLINR